MKDFLRVFFLTGIFAAQGFAGLVVGADPTELEGLSAEGLNYTLCRLNPGEREANAHNEKYFHGFGIIGKAALEAKAGRELIRALVDAVKRPEPTALCFNPGFGLTVEKDGKSRVELVICFECHAMVAHGLKTTHYPISSRPLDLFLETAKKAGLPVPSTGN